MSYKIYFDFAVCRYNLDIEGSIEGNYTPGRPAVMYLRNGDPGYPADPAEFELTEVCITDIAGQKLAEQIILDAKGQEQFYEEFCDQIDQRATDTYADQEDGGDY